MNSGECPGCQLQPPAYDAALSVSAHAGVGRELVHLLKYQKLLPVADFWAERMARMTARFPSPTVAVGSPAFDLVVPVPLGRRRQRERGFNQSEAISRRLARLCHTRHAPAAMHRRRETLAQAGLDAAARRRNLERAFVAEPKRVSGQRVLLVDDVLTTGSTAHAAAAALKRAGASQVWLFTATRADLWQVDGAAGEVA